MTHRPNKTFRKRSAYAWLQGAKVSEMAGGQYEITHPGLPGLVITEAEYGIQVHAGAPAEAYLALTPKAEGLWAQLVAKRNGLTETALT